MTDELVGGLAQAGEGFSVLAPLASSDREFLLQCEAADSNFERLAKRIKPGATFKRKYVEQFSAFFLRKTVGLALLHLTTGKGSREKHAFFDVVSHRSLIA